MNWLDSHISKSLLWLAVAFIPLQQPVVAGCCCCPDGADVVQRCATDARVVSFTPAHANCCRVTAHAGACCCRGDRLASSNSRPSDCPCRCGGQNERMVFESSSPGRTPESQWIACGGFTLLSGATTNASMADLHNSAPHVSLSGMARCIKLCRFTL
jgi:hypothetical protein